MFALLYLNEDKDNVILSPTAVGKAITIVNPQLEGEWLGLRVIHSAEPCLPGDVEWEAFVPAPFPELVSLPHSFIGTLFLNRYMLFKFLKAFQLISSFNHFYFSR